MPHTANTARYFHLTGCLTSPRDRLRRTAHYRAFLHALEDGLSAYPVRLLSYCLLPNAWHLVVGPTGTTVLKALLRRVTTTRVSQGLSQPLPVIVMPLHTGSELIGRCVVVERRPVALGLVRHVQEWPWCSPSERFRMTKRVSLVSTPVLASQAWLDHLNAPRPADVSYTTIRHDIPEEPRRLARRAERVEQSVDLVRSTDENHADTHVERPEHLGLGHTARVLQPRKDRRHRPAVAIE